MVIQSPFFYDSVVAVVVASFEHFVDFQAAQSVNLFSIWKPMVVVVVAMIGVYDCLIEFLPMRKKKLY